MGCRLTVLNESELLYMIETLRDEWENSEKYRENPTAFHDIERVGNSYMFCCPVHNESRHSCGIMIDYPHGWNCFSCDAHGSLKSLISHVIGGSDAHAEYFIDKLFYIDSGVQKPFEINKVLHKIHSIKEGKPQHSHLSEEEGLAYAGIIHPYMYQRGFTNKAIYKYELGYDKNTNSIVFPVRDIEGNIRFLQRRSVIGKSFLNERGVDRKDILYGLYYIIKSGVRLRELTIVESATDVISCFLNGMAAVALMGRYLYDEMIPLLLRLRLRNINLFLDNDKAGFEATETIAKKLCRYGFNVKICTWEVSCKDANEVHLARLMDRIKFTPLYTQVL